MWHIVGLLCPYVRYISSLTGCMIDEVLVVAGGGGVWGQGISQRILRRDKQSSSQTTMGAAQMDMDINSFSHGNRPAAVVEPMDCNQVIQSQFIDFNSPVDRHRLFVANSEQT